MDGSRQRAFAKTVFLLLLFLHALSCFVLGAMALVNWPFALQMGFRVPYSTALDTIGVVIGLELLFLGGISALSFVWTRSGVKGGTVTGIAVGLYMLTFGIVAYLKTGQVDGLLVDSLRGLLTVVFGVITHRQFDAPNPAPAQAVT